MLDLDSPETPTDPYAALQTKFEVARQAVAALAVVQGTSDGGASALANAYHSTPVPPFCLAAVISFFAAQQPQAPGQSRENPNNSPRPVWHSGWTQYRPRRMPSRSIIGP